MDLKWSAVRKAGGTPLRAAALPSVHGVGLRPHPEGADGDAQRLLLVVCWFILISPAMAGVPDLVCSLVLGATLWVVVAAVTFADLRKLSRVEHTRATPSARCVSA